MVYGVYDEAVTVGWSPSRIWKNEITILASFCSTTGSFAALLEYVRARSLRLKGVVDRTFGIEQWAEALEVVRRGEVVKAAIVF